jgi:hypothetical protein
MACTVMRIQIEGIARMRLLVGRRMARSLVRHGFLQRSLRATGGAITRHLMEEVRTRGGPNAFLKEISSMPKPLCFMIMPYGRKPTRAEAGHGVPEINFNALCDRAYAPVVEALGYEPVRADQDTGALIINQMIERLYFADLVLADMTIPNGNVYYEVGIRHASKEKGCVLLAADWSKQLFDVTQMRTVRYPLSEGEITEGTAQAIVATIKDQIDKMAKGVSPVHGSINGFPFNVDEAAASNMRDNMLDSRIQGEIRAVRAVPREARMDRAKQLVARYWKLPVTSPTALAIQII